MVVQVLTFDLLIRAGSGTDLALLVSMLFRNRVWLVAIVMVAFVAVGARQQQAERQIEGVGLALVR